MLFRLWVHEVFREICDRLVDCGEVEVMYNLVMNSLKSGVKDKLRVIYDKVCNEDGSVSKKSFTG